VPWATGSQPSPSWFYTRGNDSARIDVCDQGSAFIVVVHGPGERRRCIECADPWAVIESQIAEESYLVALGYSLERFNADRGRPTPRRWGPLESR
jgi:hypothetical protein